MKTCVFAGTFDPITIGHTDVVDKCKKLFDKVIVAVLINPEKKPFFTAEERTGFIKKLYEDDKNVEVVSYSGMLVDFMKARGTRINVRGIRNEDDYKYETVMSYYNEDMLSDIITLYVPTPKDVMHVCSTGVRELIKFNADFSRYVPEKISAYMKKTAESKTK